MFLISEGRRYKRFERTHLEMVTNNILEQKVETNGIELNVAIAGEPTNPALLLLHGLYDRWDTWDPVIRAFSGRFQVIAPDLRGHGQSEHPKSGYTPLDYQADIHGLIDALHVQQVVPVGHSLGALVGEYFAAENPDRTRAVVFVDPPLEQTEQTREWLQILLEAKGKSEEETFATVKELNIMTGDDAEWKRQTEWLRATADGPFEAMIDMIDSGRAAQLYEVLRRVSAPTLLLQADPDSGGALSDRGSDLALNHLEEATHRRFDGTGHSIHLEETEEFIQVVSDFLKQVP
jgi:pimeloyl-ACP methyl ester carboxylesterase